ncbi:hypothetical protein FJZ26_03430 [Candidatus Parvarchaeota archaeon]|nr:hypothetical protein [Candidatus Parvarchaeota archaeon]
MAANRAFFHSQKDQIPQDTSSKKTGKHGMGRRKALTLIALTGLSVAFKPVVFDLFSKIFDTKTVGSSLFAKVKGGKQVPTVAKEVAESWFTHKNLVAGDLTCESWVSDGRGMSANPNITTVQFMIPKAPLPAAYDVTEYIRKIGITRFSKEVKSVYVGTKEVNGQMKHIFCAIDPKAWGIMVVADPVSDLMNNKIDFFTMSNTSSTRIGNDYKVMVIDWLGEKVGGVVVYSNGQLYYSFLKDGVEFGAALDLASTYSSFWNNLQNPQIGLVQLPSDGNYYAALRGQNGSTIYLVNISGGSSKIREIQQADISKYPNPFN